jgi:hypothetical protein
VVFLVVRMMVRNRRLVDDGYTPPEGGRVLYVGIVTARVRRSGSRSFTSMKNGLGAISLLVTENSVDLSAVGGFGGLARFAGADFVLDPEATTMRRNRVGWLGTSLFAADSVVITGHQSSAEIEIAIAPSDRDVVRLEQALADAGVRSLSVEPGDD